MQALRRPGSVPPTDATWQELVPLTTELFYEKSGLLRFFFFFWSDYKNKAGLLLKVWKMWKGIGML